MRRQRIFNLVMAIVLLAAPFQPIGIGRGSIDLTDETSTLLFRARVQLPDAYHFERLKQLGVLILEEGEGYAVVLVDDVQLEQLARLQFKPQEINELNQLVQGASTDTAWIKSSLQPLLDIGKSYYQVKEGVSLSEEQTTPTIEDAHDQLVEKMSALSQEQQAGITSLSSIDDDGDGLTNTEEQWWCTDPMNPNSDGDAQGFTDGQEVRALLDFTLPRNVRWGYGPPFGPPNAWPNFNNRDGTGVKVCNDGDKDTIPDYAEVYMVGTRVPEQSTDHDKFDDGQELFGITFCPGDPPNPCWGTLPAGEYWNFIQDSMPNWVLPPGDSPLVAAFPVPEVYVTPGSWHVERVTTITTSQGEMTQREHSYETSVTRGESTGIANTVTWNNWEEVSQAIERPLAVASATSARRPQDFWGDVAWGSGKIFLGGIAIIGGLAACVETIGLTCVGGVGSGLYLIREGGSDWEKAMRERIDQYQKQKKYPQSCSPSGSQAIASAVNDDCSFDSSPQRKVETVSAQRFDTQSQDIRLDGTQYTKNSQGDLLARELHDISYQLSRPRYTETRTNGRSWGGSQTTTHEVYEEHTISEGEAFTTGQNWSTAWAVDSSHAADLTFEFTVKNTGTEYARELSGIVVNVYIGDDTSPAISYPAWENFPGGKLENLFPVGPNTPPGQFSTRTFVTNRIPLSLEQMKRIDLGERLTVKVESYSYGADELFYTNAVSGGVTVYIEDGVEDGDETVDSYVIPTWGVETVQDVLTRFFPAGYDAEGNLNALWTPEFNGINPPTWHEHYLSDIAWWNVYLTQSDAGDTPLKDLPAQAGSGILFRFNRDSDRDGYNDRAEFRYYCALPDSHPDRPHCADAHQRPEIHPQPEVAAGYVAERSGNVVTVKLALQNTGTFDAYGIDAVMYSPDDTTTIGNNTVGGNGRVRPGHHVAVGSLIKPPDLANWGASTAKPYAGGQFSGAVDRTFTFTAETPGVVGQGDTSVSWSDGAGNGGVIPLGGSYHAPLPVDVAQGVQVGFNTGTIAAGARFTVQALTPRDTFTYTINSEPFTPPVIVVSFSDPQGSHRFVTPVELPNLDTSIAPDQMLAGLQLQIVTPASFNAESANTTHLVINNPHPATIHGGHLYLNFVSDGKLVLEKSYTLDIQSGPTVFPADWSVAEFSADYHPDGDNLLIAFWTDSEGNIIDSAARPLSSFQEDPRPVSKMAEDDLLWDFGQAQQGTLLQKTVTLANTGYMDLISYLGNAISLTVSGPSSLPIMPSDTAVFTLTLNTQYLPVGEFSETIPVRTSDPDHPERTITIQGEITPAAPDTPRSATIRPLDWSATIPGNHNQGEWVEFTHELGPEPQTLHPAKVYSQDYATLWGVGKYATPFGQGTASYDMFGDGRDGDLVVGSGQTIYLDNARSGIIGIAYAGQTIIPVAAQQTYEVHWVNAFLQWSDTNLDVYAGQHLRFRSNGTACYAGGGLCYGPNGRGGSAPGDWLAPGLPELSLVAKIGDGPIFFVGSSLDFVANRTGRLYLAPNDLNSGYGDNNGGYLVDITAYVPGIPSGFAPGDEVLIYQTAGDGAGQFEFARVTSLGSSSIVLSTPLQRTYSSEMHPSKAQVVRVPNYRNVTVRGNGVITSHRWRDGSPYRYRVGYPVANGGVVVFRVANSLVIESGGKISADALGFVGGAASPWDWAFTGESYTGWGGFSRSPNAGGGGGSQSNGTGGGGGYGSRGSNGREGNYGEGGYTYNDQDPALTKIFLGSGGGGAVDKVNEPWSDGASGGGIILIYAQNIQSNGQISANGGQSASARWEGGGGSGGSIKLVGARIAGSAQATGGVPSRNGGIGGVGRIRIEYCESFSGSTNPAASTQKLNCYIAEQVESAPYTTTRLNLPESFTDGRTYQVQYGRRLVFGAAEEQTTTLRVPAGMVTDVSLDSLVSQVGTGSLTFRLDIGNDGSWDWEYTGNVTDAATLNSPSLTSAFNAYWAAHGAPRSGTLDVPLKVSLSKSGEVMLTNLQMAIIGSKLRQVRVPAADYSQLNLDLEAGQNGSGAFTVAADVGDDGSVDWAFSGNSSYPARLSTSNLASAFNAYLSGKSGDVDVPVRFFIEPDLPLTIQKYHPTLSAKPDATLSAADIGFNASSPVEGDSVGVTANLHNSASVESGRIMAAFYTTTPEWGEWYIGSTLVPNIPAGGSATAEIQWNTEGFNGDVPLKVVIDPYQRVSETNENNNSAVKNLTIRTRPDLEIPQITFSDDEPMAGETVNVSLQLRNNGQAQAGSQTVALYQGNPDTGGIEIGSSSRAPLDGGGTDTVTFAWTPNTPGPYRLFARVDTANAVKESHEENNEVWQDIYVGLPSPILLDSGTSGDVPYDPARGYGFIDEGQTDALSSCGSQPYQTLRRDPGGKLVYQFDHLLPGHFYHLDVVLYECDQAGRVESIKVDEALVAGPEDLSDGRVHGLSVRLEPAFYRNDHSVRVTIEAPGIDGAVVGAVNLYDVDYRYADAGGSNDPSYPSGGERNYGWLDGVANTDWGILPYQSVRVDQGDNTLRYRFDQMEPTKSYQLLLTIWQPSGAARIQKIQIDGVDTELIVNSGDYQVHRLTLDVPKSFYSSDGSIIVGIVRTSTSANSGAFVNEIALEEKTITAESLPPVADFEAAPVSGYAPLTVQFIDKSSGTITSRLWNFGDGSTATTTNPVHTYQSAGLYSVTLTVTGPGGENTKTMTNLINVSAVPPSSTVVKVTPSSAIGSIGVPITVTVAISNVTSLGSFEFTLNYDPAKIAVQNIRTAEFPGSTGRSFTPVGSNINNTTGQASFGAFSLGETPPGASGSGGLAYIRILPIASGTTNLQLSDVQVSNVAGSQIGILTQDGIMQILSCTGDFDGDGDVDILDVQRVAYRWNSHPGEPLYDVLYDVDKDGDIDILDIQTVAYRWGTQCGASAGEPASLTETLANASLGIAPPAGNVMAGQVITRSVVITNAEDLGAFEFTLAYNPQLVEVQNVTLGTFPGSSGRTFSALGPVIDGSNGKVTFGAYSVGNTPAGASGNGVLAIITLRALASGSATISFDSGQVSNRMGSAQPIESLSAGVLSIIPPFNLYLPLAMK